MADSSSKPAGAGADPPVGLSAAADPCHRDQVGRRLQSIAAHLSDHSSSGGGLTLSHDLKDTIREGKELGEGEKERRYNFTPAPPTPGISSAEVNKGKMGKPRVS